MPVKKRATSLSQFAELLDLFPCPAWVEDASGRILARNAHEVAGASCSRRGEQNALPTLKTTVLPLPPADKSSQSLRLVALFPFGREIDCLWRAISSFLASAFQPQQLPVVDEALLTPRQREIYRAYSQGLRCKEIAAQLGIAHSTVLVQIHRAREVLGVDVLPYQRKSRRWA